MCAEASSPGATLHPIATVGIVAKTGLQNAAPVVRDVVNWLEGRNLRPVVEAGTAVLAGLSSVRTAAASGLPDASDLILVLGGDGTLLGMARQIAAAEKDPPILAVNFGSLGFLTEITLPELFDALASVLDGRARVDERKMLRSRTVRGDAVLTEQIVLNDVVITKSALSGILDLSVSVGDQFVARFKADGLIIATPTGSTAYNLSAGGPIVHPLVNAVVLTPIAPHALTNRPVVLPETSAIRIQPEPSDGRTEAFASFDGQTGYKLESGDTVIVERAPRSLRMIRAASRPYFAVLREKLRWAER
ncbi:MAG: NAD(+) kinase [Acidobacteria bacterium]|jgi:NAD+ kinase|nr:NAD(+) kinase [Acidobacteriota bacterium]MDP7338608.1 NAD(+)/NADH kinase [Vicinamibacterales bacterium]MDP7479509.1 NAD(+)/NADH kinase [Vicinamibacterales bacterium]HJN45188.1 NAD(+)/NADH kinase [Vicinamibacterales bacterium]|tara:strand:- start:113 stop:1027 length:915 start_codon:yes stop_codon:yes gene_type:complete